MAKLPGCNLEFVREDDYVEYFIFPELPESLRDSAATVSTLDAEALEQLRNHLLMVQEKCLAIVGRHVEECHYVWHKDEFQLQLRIGTAQEALLNDEQARGQDTVALPPHLHGITHYGDNLDDEWFIVHLICALTRELSGSIARVIDDDGEFLLIEAADVLPKWANPETCEQRVYISDGHLQLVQNSPSHTIKLIPVATSITKIQQNPTLYRVTKEIQNCIDERLKEFRTPQVFVEQHHHHQIVRLPMGVAALLKKRPALISAAVHAFVERDLIDLKACRTMRFFPPEQRVRSNVLFTRCLYGMIMHSNYVPERKIGWNLFGASNTEQYKEDLLGVKIACGFEILASQAKDAKQEENDNAWRAYVHSLKSKGYFRDNIEGSVEYQRLMGEAKTYYQRNNDGFRTAPLVGREILDLLCGLDINAEQLRDEENNLKPSDSDDWLNITAEQLDAMLLERYGPKKLYKSNGDIDAAEFTKNLAEFLEKQSEFDCIDSDDVDDDDDDGDEDVTNENSKAYKEKSDDFKAKVKKNNSMRKACKNNPIIDSLTAQNQNTSMLGSDSTEVTEGNSFTTHVRNFLDFVIPEDKWDSNSEMSDYEDDEDLERNFDAMTSTEMSIDADIKAYMAQMDKELSNTTIGKSFERKAKKNTNTTSVGSGEDSFDDIESFEPININVNTLKNMMDSYKSQIGGAGPASNLLNAMGVGMSAAATKSATADETEQSKDISESAV